MSDLFVIQVIQSDCHSLVQAECSVKERMGSVGYWTMMLLLMIGIGLMITLPILVLWMLLDS